MGVDSLRVSLESYQRKYEITQRRDTHTHNTHTHAHMVWRRHRVGTGTNKENFREQLNTMWFQQQGVKGEP